MIFKQRQFKTFIEIILILGIIMKSFSLHLHFQHSSSSQLTIMHKQTDQQLQSYVNSLKYQKISFQNQFQNILSSKLVLQSQVLQAQNNSEKITLYENFIINTKQKLSQLKKTLNIPLNQSNSVCKSMTPVQKQILTSNISSINAQIKYLNTSIIDLIPNSTQKQSINQLIENAKSENDQILANIYAKVQQSPKKPESINNTNLIDSKWILGNQTIQALNNGLKDDNQNLYGITCPLQTPYVIFNNQCAKCPLSAPYFDMLLQKCINCTKTDQNHVCLDNKTFTTTNIQAAKDKLLVPLNKSINDYIPLGNISNSDCPIDKPFYNGLSCINCQNLFDLSTKTCTNCKQTQKFNLTTHTCQNASTNNNSTPSQNNTNNQTSPISNNSTNLPTIYSTNKNNYTNVLIPNGQTFEQYKSDQANKQNQKKVVYCESLTPYFNGTACIQCSQNQLFSIITMSCTKCSSTQFFNNISHHCENKTFCSNLQKQNWMSNTKTPQQIISSTYLSQQQLGAQKCPYSQPYFNNNSCISCNSQEQYFSFDSLKCQVCPTNSAFSKTTHKCQKFQGYFQTNPSIAPNLLYDGHSKNELMHIYYTNIDQKPQTQDCPINTPYFDGVKCINCTIQKPYFNLGTQICQQCQQGYGYNETYHQCLSTEKQQVSQTPTLQKMAAGIFS